MRKPCTFFKCMCSKPTALRKLQHSRAHARILLPRKFCPEVRKHRRDMCLPIWFAWQIKVGTEAGAGNCCYNYITADIKALVSWLLTLLGVLSVASSVSIRLRVSVLAYFPTHAYLWVLQMASCSPWRLCSVHRTAAGQFLGLLLGSVSENTGVCSGIVMVDRCNCCLGL